MDRYKLKDETREAINEHFKRILGISYDEFELLDVDEQQKLISEYHKRHPQRKSDTEIVMIGSGENALFLKVKKGQRYMVTSGDHSIMARAGETREEQDRRINAYLDRQAETQKPKGLKQLIKRMKG